MKNMWLQFWMFFLFSTIIFSDCYAQYPYIRIADVVVSSNNQDSITSSYIIGTVKFDSATNTLTLQNATVLPYQIETQEPCVDCNWVVSIGGHNSTVNIKLIGDNVISGIYPLVLSEGSFNIKGPGTLTLNSMGFEGVLCDLDVPSFIISQDAQVNINVPYGNCAGFSGSTGDYAHTIFEVDSSSVTISAKKCITHIEGFQLHGCYISYPEGAYYDHDSLSLVVGNGIVREHLAIRPGTVGVRDMEIQETIAWGTLGGIQVRTDGHFGEKVAVINVLGQTLYNGIVYDGNMFVPMCPGVYVVRMGDKSVKVMVR